jgi:hypothetical protein
MTAAPPAEAAALARALLGHALIAFRVLPDPARAAGLAAIDRFVADPRPSLFLAAVRELDDLRRRGLIESTAATTVRRGRDAGLEALRAVPGFPAAITERLEHGLPLDARAGQRLQALAALASSYEGLAGQVAADTDEMRQRLRPLAGRSARARTASAASRAKG